MSLLSLSLWLSPILTIQLIDLEGISLCPSRRIVVVGFIRIWRLGVSPIMNRMKQPEVRTSGSGIGVPQEGVINFYSCRGKLFWFGPYPIAVDPERRWSCMCRLICQYRWYSVAAGPKIIIPYSLFLYQQFSQATNVWYEADLFPEFNGW